MTADGPPGPSAWTAADRAAFTAEVADRRVRARGRLSALRRDFTAIVEGSADAARDDEHDPEGATIAFERAQVARLLQDAHDQLAALDEAERRARDGTLDVCSRCDAPIGAARLLARPTARTCVGCERDRAAPR